MVRIAAFAVLMASGASAATLKELPVREVTIFKDGHALVLHEGTVPVKDNVASLTGLPRPLLGTFWPYSMEGGGSVASATARERDSAARKPAGTVMEVLAASVGRTVDIVTSDRRNDDALVLRGKIASAPEAGATHVLLEQDGRTRALAIAKIVDVIDTEAGNFMVPKGEKETALDVRFNFAKRMVYTEAKMGVGYVQEGLRWIPNYRLTVGEGGKGRLELQATIVNDLVDMENARARLVIGVPNFAAKGEIDPISLQKVVAQVEAAAGRAAGYRQFSNVIMAQSASYYNEGGDAAPAAPTVTAEEKREDLFVFQIDGITLKAGERTIVPVASYDVDSETVFKMTVPWSPPFEVRREIMGNRGEEAKNVFQQPAVKTNLRVKNGDRYPITTAPVMIYSGDQLLAQSTTRYTPIGGQVDIEVSTAVDIPVRVTSRETNRQPGDRTWRNTSLTRVDCSGAIALSNRRTGPVTVEVRREVLGKALEAAGGKATQLAELDEEFGSHVALPVWWSWYSWPWWWHQVNGAGVFEWTETIPQGESRKLEYTWSYFWQE